MQIERVCLSDVKEDLLPNEMSTSDVQRDKCSNLQQKRKTSNSILMPLLNSQSNARKSNYQKNFALMSCG